MIDVRPLFKPIDDLLIEFLKSMEFKDWQKPTVAKKWKVKDVVSHLLDGNLRVLSIQRDRYFGGGSPDSFEFRDMVKYLNQLNADWVHATQRLSPQVLILLHELTGPLVSSYYQQLYLNEEAIFSVDWAGESKSLNWMHLAREYSEKWHHQQQIRDALGNHGLMKNEYFLPCMDTFFYALPHTLRNTQAKSGTTIKVNLSGEVGGNWFIQKTETGWQLTEDSIQSFDTEVIIPSDVSWKLFTKSIRPESVMENVKIIGDEKLGSQVLEMVAVMA